MQDGEMKLEQHDIFYIISNHAFKVDKIYQVEFNLGYCPKLNMTHFSDSKSMIREYIKYVVLYFLISFLHLEFLIFT